MAIETPDSTGTEQEAEASAIDTGALRSKYDEEREKRIRADGNDQYLKVEGEFARYLDDPYIDPGFEREPLMDEVEVAIIGGGFGGILAGVRLREEGVEDIRVIDAASDFGGTWYWNRYPGAACDVESYVYLPLLEETDYMPKEKYVGGPEILEHSKRIARKFDLYRDTCFQTRVTEVRWDEDAARWIISTNRGDRMRAHFVCMALGILNRPKLPGIRGIEDFRGHTFHASRWDYRYTGGSCEGGLTGLAGKRVGIIGTGATAVQCVPHVGEAAAHLFVFQRTPSSIDEKVNRPTEPEWAKSLKPGWQQQRMDNFNILVSGGFQEEDLVNDGWTDIIRNLTVMVQKEEDPDVSPEAMAKTMEIADFQKMEEIRARVESIVKDKTTAEALKPYYRQFCKRPCFHNEYLDTFNRPNVTLVDTKGQGVDRITEKGVVVDGQEFELDCLIYASGFEVGTSYAQRAGYEIYGRGGKSLSEHWGKGTRTLHGMHVRGFPNCFFVMSNVQSGITVSYPHMLGEQGKQVGYIVKRAIEKNLRSIEVSEAAEAEWVDTIIRLARERNDFQVECTPSYYNNEGNPGIPQDGFYEGGSVEFMQLPEDWRSEGELRGLDRCPEEES